MREMVYEKTLNQERDTLKRFPYLFLLTVILLVACGSIPGRGATPTLAPSNNPELMVTQLPAKTSTPRPTASTTLTPAPVVPSNKITYNVSNEDFANPERGFMKQSSIFPEQLFDAQKVRALQPADTLVWIYFRLDNYRDRLIDQNGLNTIRSAFTTARSRGLKLVIRFAYNPGPGSTTDANLANPDAPIDLVLQHIEQLKPILVENSDVIAVMQAGFVGHWGEWHSSKYLHSLEARRAVIDALFSALPKDRMLQIRYPRYKEIFFQGPLTEQEAYSVAIKVGSAITMTVSCGMTMMPGHIDLFHRNCRNIHRRIVMGRIPSPAGRTSLPQSRNLPPWEERPASTTHRAPTARMRFRKWQCCTGLSSTMTTNPRC